MPGPVPPYPGHGVRPGRTGWSDETTRSSLLLLAEALGEALEFLVVTLSVVDDAGMCQIIAVAGDDDARELLLGTKVALRTLEAMLGGGERAGEVSFVRELTVDPALTQVRWETAPPAADGSSWHSDDWLAARVRDGAGEVVGLVQLDVPADGRRPDPGRLTEIDRRCATVARGLTTARERERLASQTRMALTARDVVRATSGRRSIEDILGHCHQAVLDGFRARGLYLRLLDDESDPHAGRVYQADGGEITVPRKIGEIAERDARRAWAAQEVAVFHRDYQLGGWLAPEDTETMLEFHLAAGLESTLFVPIGVDTCLGSLTLARLPGDPAWDDDERRTALEIGHDLGHAVGHALAHQREQKLLAELRELDAEKSSLISTVSHELRNPLTAVAGHLEMLRHSSGDWSTATERSLAAMERGVERMKRIMEDLLLFSRLGDPAQTFEPVVLDLGRVVDDVRELHEVSARRRGQRIEVGMPQKEAWVRGLTADLDCVVSNLLSNALKYSPDDTTVRLTLVREGAEVVLSCTDQGLGISPAEQAAVFGEFFRSEDPAVRREAGTGLGLAIVGRIVQRHLGTVTLTSEVGRGSTFGVRLPTVEEFDRLTAATVR